MVSQHDPQFSEVNYINSSIPCSTNLERFYFAESCRNPLAFMNISLILNRSKTFKIVTSGPDFLTVLKDAVRGGIRFENELDQGGRRYQST